MEYKNFLEAILQQDDSYEVAKEQTLELCRNVIRFNRECPELVEHHGQDKMDKALWYVYGRVDGFMHDILWQDSCELWDEFFNSVYDLYVNVYNKYCGSCLCSQRGNRKKEKPLNSSCYMLWDMCGIEGPVYHKHPVLTDPSFELLSKILTLENVACQESALHGLGHLAGTAKHPVWPTRVKTIIDEYIGKKKPQKELREYADFAACGRVQ